MAYRPLLSADQWTSLLAAPADERTLIRYASLSGEDLDLILSKRGHRNQLGFAVQICLMRFPGRALALNEIRRLCFIFSATNSESARLLLLTMLGATRHVANI